MTQASVLIHPQFDKPFILYYDACRKGIGGALHQMVDGVEHPVLFISHILTPAEVNYRATELKCLAVVWNLSELEHFLDGSSFKIVTDHSAPKWIWNIKAHTNSYLFKWSLILNLLKDKVEIVHRLGCLHSNVDPLSRYPMSYYSTTLIHISEEWRKKLKEGYRTDPVLRKVWKRIQTAGTMKTNQSDRRRKEPEQSK